MTDDQDGSAGIDEELLIHGDVSKSHQAVAIGFCLLILAGGLAMIVYGLFVRENNTTLDYFAMAIPAVFASLGAYGLRRYIVDFKHGSWISVYRTRVVTFGKGLRHERSIAQIQEVRETQSKDAVVEDWRTYEIVDTEGTKIALPQVRNLPLVVKVISTLVRER